ncbi:GNAT family N-acetyltransferase [Marinicella rhabdoformis]|uniref:GNAT family N-acetyltransferase n=1 Tax=Marinicella rhabdoformis TaxID=2580566 RepID=UPI0012AEB9BD|nr:GNAT family N-acetyltransferase [Marinicella rhabdoformis]
MMSPILTTERLVLSHISTSDIQLIFDIFTDPVCIRFIGDRGIRSLDDAKSYIAERFVGHYEKHGFGMYKVSFNNKGIGICGLIQRDEAGPPDIGFAFLTDYRGGGFCTEAAQAVLDYENQRHELPEILAYTDPENTASQKVLEKLGMKRKEVTQLKGQDVDSLVFVLKNT